MSVSKLGYAHKLGYQEAEAGAFSEAHWLQIVFGNMCGGDYDLLDDLFDAYTRGVDDYIADRDRLRAVVATYTGDNPLRRD